MSQVKPQLWWPGINSDDPLARGLVGYWPLWAGAGQTAFDVVGNNDGVINGATWVEGSEGISLDFNGSGSVITIPDSPSLRFGTGNFSMVCQYLLRSASSIDSLAGKGDIDSGEWMWNARHDVGIGQRFYGDGGSVNADAAKVDSLNTWYVSAVVRRAGILTVYQNGEPVATDSSATADFDTPKDLQIGGADSHGQRWFDGAISIFSVYRLSLIQSQIQDLYQDPYRLFTPPTHRVYSIPSGVAVVTSPWYHNLQQQSVTSGA